MAKREEIQSLNETILGTLSTDELDTRLELERLQPQGELWTGCGCDGYTCPYCPCDGYCPYHAQDCPADSAGQPGCTIVWSW